MGTLKELSLSGLVGVVTVSVAGRESGHWATEPFPPGIQLQLSCGANATLTVQDCPDVEELRKLAQSSVSVKLGMAVKSLTSGALCAKLRARLVRGAAPAGWLFVMVIV